MNPIRQWCTHCIQLGEPHAVGGEWIYGGTFRSWSIQDCASILSNPVLHLEHDRYSVGFAEIQGIKTRSGDIIDTKELFLAFLVVASKP